MNTWSKVKTIFWYFGMKHIRLLVNVQNKYWRCLLLRVQYKMTVCLIVYLERGLNILRIFYILQIGHSLYDEEGSKIVGDLMAKAAKKEVKILFPVDFVTADKFSQDANVSNATVCMYHHICISKY